MQHISGTKHNVVHFPGRPGIVQIDGHIVRGGGCHKPDLPAEAVAAAWTCSICSWMNESHEGECGLCSAGRPEGGDGGVEADIEETIQKCVYELMFIASTSEETIGLLRSIGAAVSRASAAEPPSLADLKAGAQLRYKKAPDEWTTDVAHAYAEVFPGRSEYEQLVYVDGARE